MLLSRSWSCVPRPNSFNTASTVYIQLFVTFISSVEPTNFDSFGVRAGFEELQLMAIDKFMFITGASTQRLCLTSSHHCLPLTPIYSTSHIPPTTPVHMHIVRFALFVCCCFFLFQRYLTSIRPSLGGKDANK